MIQSNVVSNAHQTKPIQKLQITQRQGLNQNANLNLNNVAMQKQYKSPIQVPILNNNQLESPHEKLNNQPNQANNQIGNGNQIVHQNARSIQNINAQQKLQQQLPARLTRCPDCNSILRINYSCTPFTVAWSLFLLLGLTCWVPCVVDACKKSQAKCLTCDKIVQTYNPSC